MEKCRICDKELKAITWKHLWFKHSMKIEEYDEQYGVQKHGVNNSTPESVAKANATKKERHINPWNYGLTKDTHKSLQKISEDRCGDKNPYFKIVDKEQWMRNVKEGRKAYDESRRGKTLEKLYGKERADIIKENQSQSAKVREIHGHTGFLHTEETKQKLREITAKRISDLKDKVSKPQRLLFERLQNELNQYSWELEYNVGFYSIDIADKSNKIAIEVDGDFYHVNEEKGFTIKYEIQKRNKNNEKSKTTYLLNRNWKLIRVWESAINDNIETAIEKIKGHLI